MRLLALLVGIALPGFALAQDGTWALTNARIETVTRGVIERGTVVIRDGLIEAVGADVRAPADARIVDLAGKRVYPGLIDLTSTMGLASAPASGGGAGAGGQGGSSAQSSAATVRNVGLEPGRVIANELRPSASDIRAARDAGITTVLVAPSRGAFRGLSALVPLRDESAEQYVVKSPVALHMGFQGAQGSGFGGRYPATLLGVIAYERQSLYDARHHAAVQERYRAGARGAVRPSYDVDLDALVPVVRGAVPAFFAADRENEIRRAVRVGDEFDLKLTIVGATEGFRAIDALKRADGVVVSLDFPRSTEVTGWSYRATQRHALDDSAATDSAVRRTLESNAATLHSAGVRFALASGGLRPGEFLGNVRKAIAAGLPRDVALQALTVRAAEIAGVGAQLGSIEAGKIANLVVAERDILGDSANVRMVFVDGIRHEVIPQAAAERRRGAGGGRGGEREEGGEMARVAGTWDITVTSPQGENRASMTVTQSGATLEGTMATEMGTVQVTDGRITGERVTFSIAVPISGQTTTIMFRGTVNGNRMTGTADLGAMGSATFTGERRP
ncbi:MAG TPA: amidohydrolase family protein [Gemmatimonadaceae bacterium]|nr:amidohydrolase family protein [Gemmatimonadaceae bacterium]